VNRPIRHHQIILLERTLTPALESPFDYQPKIWSKSLGSVSGDGPTTTRKCSHPGGDDGKVRIRGIEQTCPDCNGRGLEVVDAYTERKVRTQQQEIERPRRMVRCDECGGTGQSKWWRNGDRMDNSCRRCWGAKVVPGPDQTIRPFRGSLNGLSTYAHDLGRGDPVLDCMERRQLAGSYDELGLALSALRLDHRRAFRINVRVYVAAIVEAESLTLRDGILLDESVRYLDSLMPGGIRVPAWAEGYEERRRAQLNGVAA